MENQFCFVFFSHSTYCTQKCCRNIICHFYSIWCDQWSKKCGFLLFFGNSKQKYLQVKFTVIKGGNKPCISLKYLICFVNVLSSEILFDFGRFDYTCMVASCSFAFVHGCEFSIKNFFVKKIQTVQKENNTTWTNIVIS